MKILRSLSPLALVAALSLSAACGRKTEEKTISPAPAAQERTTLSTTSDVPATTSTSGTVAGTTTTTASGSSTTTSSVDALERELAAFGASETVPLAEVDSFAPGMDWPQTLLHAQNHCKKKGTGAYSGCEPVAKKFHYTHKGKFKTPVQGQNQGPVVIQDQNQNQGQVVVQDQNQDQNQGQVVIQDQNQGQGQVPVVQPVRKLKHTVSYRYKCKSLKEMPAQVKYGQDVKGKFIQRQDDQIQKLDLETPYGEQFEFELGLQSEQDNALSSRCAIQVMGWESQELR